MTKSEIEHNKCDMICGHYPVTFAVMSAQLNRTSVYCRNRVERRSCQHVPRLALCHAGRQGAEWTAVFHGMYAGCRGGSYKRRAASWKLQWRRILNGSRNTSALRPPRVALGLPRFLFTKILHHTILIQFALTSTHDPRV